jgi:hypothetical protein
MIELNFRSKHICLYEGRRKLKGASSIWPNTIILFLKQSAKIRSDQKNNERKEANRSRALSLLPGSRVGAFLRRLR